MNGEAERLRENAAKKIPLEQWGPYLAERQWGTVREDYSHNGDAWGYFPFEHAHARAYIWGEDGIAGISDYFQNMCFSVGFWNGHDRLVKERLFGLVNFEGNHGEDVKELYYYLDNTPTHYYMEYLYKYPHKAFPYDKLREENRKRSRLEPEYELLDTGVFDKDEYFDAHITYAKNKSTDIFIRIRITNRGHAAPITVIPTLWFYNRWQQDKNFKKPSMVLKEGRHVRASHPRIGHWNLYFQKADDLLFTENETNHKLVTGREQRSPYTKDAINDAIVSGRNLHLLRKKKHGTKFSPVYRLHLKHGETSEIYLRLVNEQPADPFPSHFKGLFDLRKKEADEFFDSILTTPKDSDIRNVQRQALAGLLWSKQYYHYDVERWIKTGDGITEPGHSKAWGRNHDWKHLKNQDIISMPDKWEFPWYAAWDLAFQCIPMAMVDPTFAKHQLLLIMREWYMKPDGQLPAYEWNFSDVNPPVQAWAAMEVYKIERDRNGGKGDLVFLKKAFHKLLINFTWWINRKDPNGNNMFEGGFLGLDNIGVFNRSAPLNDSMHLEQADGTAWMGMYALNLLDMSLEIALHDPSFEDTATKFFEQFVLIAEALNHHGMWNEEDEFFYDTLSISGSAPLHLRIQSIVGLTSLFAVSVIRKEMMDKLEDFSKRINWFEQYRKKNNLFWPNEEHGEKDRTLVSLLPRERLESLMKKVLNEDEFLSENGIRALSKYYEKNPYTVHIAGVDHTIQYDPGDSTSDFFGGNSNWRGPVWIPMNYLIIRSIRRYGRFYGDSLKVEFPTGSGQRYNLKEVANKLTERLTRIFLKDEDGCRRVFGEYADFYKRPGNEHLVLYYEYFHGDTGKGLGANHQTGWTALIAELVERALKD